MEWKCCMFGSTVKDKKNWISDLFAFCGRQLLTLSDCSKLYYHMLSINALGQQIMACNKFLHTSYVNITMNISQILFERKP